MSGPHTAGALKLLRSNRVERLVEALARELREPPGDPFAPEIVVVHSAEMGRWLSLQLAHELGVCANVRFDFPGKVVSRLFGATEGPEPEGDDRWSRDALVWALLKLLPEVLDTEAFAPLRGYLGGEHRLERVSRKEYGLATRLAAVFDRYITFRPEMIQEWDDGGPAAGDDWQQLLWRRLAEVLGPWHTVAQARRFFSAVEANSLDAGRLPPRLFLFAISTLPPLYLDLFGALSRLVPVTLLSLCPSDQYWGDISSRRERARELRRKGWADHSAEHLHLEQGNPLLATFGALGRDFQWILEGRDAAVPYVEPAGDLFVPSGQQDLLHVLQDDILELRHRRPAPAVPGSRQVHPVALDPEDRSILVHACHGRLRQVEVLRDELLRALNEDSQLQPREIVIMTPDLEGYAPLVEAVFSDGDPDGAAGRGEEVAGFPSLPYCLADRSLRRESPVADVLLRVMELAQGRVTASEVLDLLALEPVRKQFSLTAEDLPRVQAWIGEAGIRWGVDAEHRRQCGQPLYGENTWRFGLDRLLLGWAMGADEGRMFGGVLPYGELDGDEAELLGRLVDFCETLFGHLHDLRASRTMELWQEQLEQVLETMTGDGGSTAYLLRQVRDALDGEAALAGDLEVSRELELEAVHALLDGRLSQTGSGGKFGTGAVTICAMVPLRSIPFSVVCLLGMDDDAFPRKDPAAGFDRVASHPRPGDRSVRDDDRYLFLEAILAARQRLIITYQGRGIRDNKPLPPATAVEVLLGVVEDSFLPPGRGAHDPAVVRAQLVEEHPLQAFSPRNFGGGAAGRRTSFDRRYLRGARRLRGEQSPPRAFLSGKLPPPPAGADEPRVLTIEELTRFWTGPSAYLLNRRLGIWLRDEQGAVEDREPADLSALERYSVGDRLLGRALASDPRSRRLLTQHDPRHYELVRAAGDLPLGSPGRYHFDHVAGEVERLVGVARQQLEPPRDPEVEVALELGETRLVGTLDGPWATGLVHVQYARIKAKNILSLWISHLGALLSDPEFVGSSVLVGRPRQGAPVDVGLSSLGRVEKAAARKHLQDLIDLYWRGQRAPLMFFPETSRAHAEAQRARPGDQGSWTSAARGRWSLYGDAPGEGDDAHVVRLLGDAEPFHPGFTMPGLAHSGELGFAALAQRVWAPVLDALSEEVL